MCQLYLNYIELYLKNSRIMNNQIVSFFIFISFCSCYSSLIFQFSRTLPMCKPVWIWDSAIIYTSLLTRVVLFVSCQNKFWQPNVKCWNDNLCIFLASRFSLFRINFLAVIATLNYKYIIFIFILLFFILFLHAFYLWCYAFSYY